MLQAYGRPPGRRKLLYAHRGASIRVPENTIESFRQGLQEGANALELDVQVTRDDVVVVFHDPDGFRVAGVRKRVADITWAELRTWDVGTAFKRQPRDAYRNQQVFRAPMLSEVLEAFPKALINIDVKESTLRALSLVIEILRKYNATDRSTLITDNHRMLNAARDLRYEGPTGSSRLEVAALHLLPAGMLERITLRGDAVQVPLRWGPFRFNTERFIDRCHALGFRVDYWTINDRMMAKRLYEMGADGVMTDDPASILPVFVPFMSDEQGLPP